MTRSRTRSARRSRTHPTTRQRQAAGAPLRPHICAARLCRLLPSYVEAVTSDEPDGVGAAIGDRVKRDLLWAAGEPTDSAADHDKLQDSAVEDTAVERR